MKVRDSQLSVSFRFMASHQGLRPRSAWNDDQVKRLSTVAAHMTCVLRPLVDLYTTDDVKPEEIRKTRERWLRKPCVWMLSRLRFEKLRRKKTAANLCPMNSYWACCTYALRRLVVSKIVEDVANGGKSSCVLSVWSAKSISYVSHEAVTHKREQRRVAGVFPFSEL